MHYDPLGDGISKVEKLSHGNDDLTVVNAARESFDKEKEELDEFDIKLIHYLAKHKHWTPFGHVQLLRYCYMLPEKYIEWVQFSHKFCFNRAIRVDTTYDCENVSFYEVGSLYSFIQAGVFPIGKELVHSAAAWSRPTLDGMLFKNPFEFDFRYSVDTFNVWTPSVIELADLVPVTLRLKMPLFVAYQWATHKQDLLQGKAERIVRNEQSRRYIADNPEFYTPKNLRLRAEKVKQGSSSSTVDTIGLYGVSELFHNLNRASLEQYVNLLDHQIAPELARMVLSTNMYTEFWETGTLSAWKRLCNLRLDSHAQKEIRDYAAAVNEIMFTAHPEIWAGMENDTK